MLDGLDAEDRHPFTGRIAFCECRLVATVRANHKGTRFREEYRMLTRLGLAGQAPVFGRGHRREAADGRRTECDDGTEMSPPQMGAFEITARQKSTRLRDRTGTAPCPGGRRHRSKMARQMRKGGERYPKMTCGGVPLAG
ncbi:hypothetical protein CDV49_03490 [Haematobacter genomosp. 1]|uniref:Uncharacterized protein n=1 Tax=Haematobacter genomosp. 1 TaxID=366618 RepID=A0A212AFU1_9RHOB|nr:hypothetical protein CDV49_03490 [Haematobacter genomosp. 1]